VNVRRCVPQVETEGSGASKVNPFAWDRDKPSGGDDWLSHFNTSAAATHPGPFASEPPNVHQLHAALVDQFTNPFAPMSTQLAHRKIPLTKISIDEEVRRRMICLLVGSFRRRPQQHTSRSHAVAASLRLPAPEPLSLARYTLCTQESEVPLTPCVRRSQRSR
jgi:hypothetical protein